MKRVLYALTAAATLGALPTTLAQDAEAAIEPTETIVLFNGKDLAGWEFCLRKKGGKDVDPATVFKVEDGVIKCAGTPPGYMRTKKAYTNYKLTVEWKFTKKGNSGILVHTIGKDNVWPKSLECQGMVGNQGDFFVIGGFKCNEHTAATEKAIQAAGDDKKKLSRAKRNRRVLKRGPSNEKPLNEWNVYEIVCKGDVVQPWVNGKMMNEATGCSWTSGKICLQSESAVWECRKITVEPLK